VRLARAFSALVLLVSPAPSVAVVGGGGGGVGRARPQTLSPPPSTRRHPPSRQRECCQRVLTRPPPARAAPPRVPSVVRRHGPTFLGRRRLGRARLERGQAPRAVHEADREHGDAQDLQAGGRGGGRRGRALQPSPGPWCWAPCAMRGGPARPGRRANAGGRDRGAERRARGAAPAGAARAPRLAPAMWRDVSDRAEARAGHDQAA